MVTGPELASIAILLLASLSGVYQPQPVLVASTSKSLDSFGACFTQAQDSAGRPWSFAATESGGSFSNEGAASSTAVYRLQFTEASRANQLRLYADQHTDSRPELIEVVDRCR
jgi:hypothetical protein